MPGIQEGASKVFLRQSAFEYAEKFRNETLTGATVMIQSAVRQFLERRGYHLAKGRIVTCQACARRYFARNVWNAYRERKSVVKIQGYWRMSGPRRQLVSKKYAALWLQRFYRGCRDRQSYQKLFDITTAASKLKEQQNHSPVVFQAVIPSDRAAAVANESGQERTKEVHSLDDLFARAKNEAEKAKLAVKELGCLEQHLSAATKGLNTSKSAASGATYGAKELENENMELNEKLNSRPSESEERYYNEMYSGHPDLMALDEKLQVATTQSKKAKAELKVLLQALSILS
jgi:myosin heavy subunit